MPGLLTVDEIAKLPEGVEGNCGVYFLFSGEEIIYVGSSINVGQRIIFHKYDRKPFSRHTYLAMEEGIVRDVEAAYIRALAPTLNKVHHPMYTTSFLGESKNIALQVPVAEAEKYRRAAEAEGRSLASYLRRVIRKYHEDNPAE